MIRTDSAIQGVHANGGCYVCGNPNKLVDTEVSIPFEGVLAICEGCSRDIAMTAGWDLETPTAEVERLRAENELLHAERDSSDRALMEVYETAQAANKRHKERVRKAGLKHAEG